MRYLVKVSYDGSNYHGFERQPDYRTIQEELENAVSYINDKKTVITASGRTDKGVHATSQFFHVDIDKDISEYKLKCAINSLIPDDIYVIDTKVVSDDFHARYMVKEKTYIYKLNMGEYNPIEKDYVYQFNKKLNLDKIEEAMKYFIGEHDFKAFTPNKDIRNSYTRTIYEFSVENKNDILEFKIRGTGFIKYQIRNMIGLLIQIGLEKKEPTCVMEILDSKNRSNGFRTAHACGLYLIDVKY